MAIGPRAQAAPSPLPEKIGALLRESRWLLAGGLALYLALALWGFNLADPGWSRAVDTENLHNPAGVIGAWLSDILLFLFGFSAWWWVVFALLLIFRGVRRGRSAGDVLKTEEKNSHLPLFLFTCAGFLLLLIASAALEHLRLHSWALQLPARQGGMIGQLIGTALMQKVGYTGATLVFLLCMAIGWSVCTGMSWLAFAEGLGKLLEKAALALYGYYEYWQDRRIGRNIAERREAEVETQKRRPDYHEPVLIDPSPAPPVIPVSTAAQLRIDRERQAPLIPSIETGWQLPPLHLLDGISTQNTAPAADILEFTSRLIEHKLADFGVKVKVLAALPGPVITRYEIEPDAGVKGSQIVGLSRDLARALALVSIRVVETVPGKTCMALELPNPKRQMVKLTEIIASEAWNKMSSPLTITLGKDIGGMPVVADLAKMPHLLVAGTTGSGKSVGVNAMILSLLYKSEPDTVRLILIDPKMLELSIYEGIPHLLAPVVTDMKHVANALNWCVEEMEKRYRLMSALGVRNLAGFNTKVREAQKRGEMIGNPFTLTPESPEPLSPLPYIVIIIDELADLMMVVGKKVEELIARLAQKARAAGLHLILATQRPSVDVITGLIKANIPTRISFQVSSKIDSRTVLDQMGAENLLGQGDMLYLAPGTGYPTRVHGAFVADDEVHRIVEYLKQTGTPEYVEDILTGSATEVEGGDSVDDAEADPLYDQAVAVVLKTRRPSISLVQRHLRIGYNRSARLIEAMEIAGLISPADGQGKREVLAQAPGEE
ncbi:MAG: DNA translocase FtsK 4TM domain-containing protein [Zoogloeaceae bacterium]|nr:DNA translocase FtsK 4TM domain-containing protein [Zoogloeaceae bacterium]